MAKPRDYKSEERRRNELARQRGFTTRAQQRTATRKGLDYGRPIGPKQLPYRAAGFASDKAYRQARADAKAWSKKHSSKKVSEYRPSGLHKNPQAFAAYHAAFIDKKSAVSAIGRKARAAAEGNLGGSGDKGGHDLNALQRYLQDYENYDEAEVYDDQYQDSTG
jgi:hypothetical protein